MIYFKFKFAIQVIYYRFFLKNNLNMSHKEATIYAEGSFLCPTSTHSSQFSKTNFRHDLQRTSRELGTDFLQGLSFTHEQRSRSFSAQMCSQQHRNLPERSDEGR